MKRKLFTFLVAFLATVSGTVWGQQPTEIDITGIRTESSINKGSEGLGWQIEQDLEQRKEGNILTISKAGDYKIIDNSQEVGNNKSNVQIKVTAIGVVNILLDNIRVDAYLSNSLDGTGDDPKYPDRCAFEIGENAIVKLNWAGYNKFWSGPQRAGINVKKNATLILAGPEDNAGTPKLEAGCLSNTSGEHAQGAGIGGDSTDPNFGTIIIESGTVTAYSQAKQDGSFADGAGIGGGAKVVQDNVTGSTSGVIIIKGGNVTAECDAGDNVGKHEMHGAGIGGGCRGTCTSITIIDGTVNATSDDDNDVNCAYDIGVGHAYMSGMEQPQIIIAPKDKDHAPTVNTSNITDVNNSLKVQNGSSTIEGTVTLPEGTQVYAPGLNLDNGMLKAYKIALMNEKQIKEESEESEHETRNFPEYLNDMYYGKSMKGDPTKVQIPVGVTCTLGHYFMGWYGLKANSNVDHEIKSKTFDIEIPDTDVETLTTVYKGEAVWVDNRLDIVVPSYHTWVQDNDDSNPPTIAVIPANAVSLLEFTLNKGNHDKRLDDVRLAGNVFTGTPKLESDESYKALQDVNVTVKVKDSQDTEKRIETPIFIHSGNLEVTAVEVNMEIQHEYTGEAHNNREDDSDHAFKFTVSTTDGTTLPEGFTLTEGVHYVVESFKIDDEDPTAPVEVKGSKQMIHAGKYTAIKLKAVNPTVGTRDVPSAGGIKFKVGGAEVASDSYTIPDPLTIAPKTVTLDAKDDEVIEISSEPDFSNNWADYIKIKGVIKDETIIPTGLVATVTPTVDKWWTEPGAYTVTYSVGEGTSTGNNDYAFAEETTASRELSVKADLTNPDVEPGEDSGWTLEGSNVFTRQYNGDVPSIGSLKVKLANGSVVPLTEGTGFTVNYGDASEDVGDYSVTITFKASEYITGGTAAVTLKITPCPLDITFKEKIESLDGLAIPDLLLCKGLVSDEYPEFEGTIETKLISDNTYEVTINGFIIKNATTNNFKVANYAITVDGSSYAAGNNISGTVTTDPEEPVDPPVDPTKYYNIYDVTEYDFIDVSFSRNVVREGGSVNVHLEIPEGLDPAAVTLMYKRGMYGTWGALNLNDDNQYQINNIWTDIYVKAVVDESFIDPNPDENHIYIDLSETNDSIWLYTDHQLVEEGKTAVIQAEVAKSCQNKEIRYMYKRTVLGEWKEMPKDYSINQYVVRDITTDIYVKAYFVFDKQDPTTAKNPHHVYADITATSEGLYLDATRHKVADEGDTKVFLYVKKGFETKDARYLFKRGLKGEWEDLVPGIEQNTFEVTNIEEDIYLKGIDAIYTGTEGVDGVIRVYTKDGSLYVYTAQPEEISVISMTGVTVKRTQQTGLQSYPLNQGIYVVLVGEQVFKVRVK